MSMVMDTPQVSDPDLEDDDPIHSHIVRRTEDKDAHTLVLEARIYGTPVEALCGYVWVPSRDVEKHPVCSKCVDIVKDIPV